MCLIIHRPAGGSHLPSDVIPYNANINPDGFGLAWRDNAGLRHEKFGPNKAEREKFLSMLSSLDASGMEYVAHFRKATHGAACTALAHPFLYTDRKAGNVLVFHNGIIPIKPKHGESDTSAFVYSVLAKLTPRWWGIAHLKFLVEQSVGWSRLLVMTAKETVRLNEDDWHSYDGIWYSTSPFPPFRGGGKKKCKADSKGSVVYMGSGKGYESASADRYTLSDVDAVMRPAIKTMGGGWWQAGHYCVPVTEDTDGTGDAYGDAICQNCDRSGSYYVIEGKVYLDIAHLDDADFEEAAI